MRGCGSRPARLAVVLLLTGAAAAAVPGCGGKKVTGSDNGPPRIVALVARPTAVTRHGTTQITVLASDPDQDVLYYRWIAAAGTFDDSTSSGTLWTAPDSAGTFTLFIRVSDGADSVSSSVDITAGNASLTVLSDPPGANLTVDGTLTIRHTPFTFSPLAPGVHQVAAAHPDYVLSPASFSRDLADGDADTVRFTLGAAQIEVLKPGRTDLLEVGGIAFLPTGVGYLYAARTPTGTGIFSSPLNPLSGSPNGLRVASGVRIQEPITVSADGRFVIYIDEARNLLLARAIFDTNADGVIDSVQTPIELRTLDTFAPDISTDNRIAYSLAPSEELETAPVFWDTFQDSMMAGEVHLGGTVPGKLPTWEPGTSYLAFVSGNSILTSYADPEGGIPSADTLVVGDGVNTAPTWGPWGPHHVAYLHGEDAAPLTEIRLATRNTDPVVVKSGLSDPRYVAWNPVQRAVAVTHHPGGAPQILFVYGLPIP